MHVQFLVPLRSSKSSAVEYLGQREGQPPPEPSAASRALCILRSPLHPLSPDVLQFHRTLER